MCYRFLPLHTTKSTQLILFVPHTNTLVFEIYPKLHYTIYTRIVQMVPVPYPNSDKKRAANLSSQSTTVFSSILGEILSFLVHRRRIFFAFCPSQTKFCLFWSTASKFCRFWPVKPQLLTTLLNYSVKKNNNYSN